MLRVVQGVMQLGAVLIAVCIGLALHGWMPGVPLWKAALYLVVLIVAAAFAVTLVLSSLLIGSVPRRSKLGEKLAGKIDRQTGGARQRYDELRRNATGAKAGAAEAAVRPTHGRCKGSETPLQK